MKSSGTHTHAHTHTHTHGCWVGQWQVRFPHCPRGFKSHCLPLPAPPYPKPGPHGHGFESRTPPWNLHRILSNRFSSRELREPKSVVLRPRSPQPAVAGPSPGSSPRTPASFGAAAASSATEPAGGRGSQQDDGSGCVCAPSAVGPFWGAGAASPNATNAPPPPKGPRLTWRLLVGTAPFCLTVQNALFGRGGMLPATTRLNQCGQGEQGRARGTPLCCRYQRGAR
jgi:hypothetical protein